MSLVIAPKVGGCWVFLEVGDGLVQPDWVGIPVWIWVEGDLWEISWRELPRLFPPDRVLLLRKRSIGMDLDERFSTLLKQQCGDQICQPK